MLLSTTGSRAQALPARTTAPVTGLPARPFAATHSHRQPGDMRVSREPRSASPESAVRAAMFVVQARPRRGCGSARAPRPIGRTDAARRPAIEPGGVRIVAFEPLQLSIAGRAGARLSAGAPSRLPATRRHPPPRPPRAMHARPLRYRPRRSAISARRAKPVGKRTVLGRPFHPDHARLHPPQPLRLSSSGSGEKSSGWPVKSLQSRLRMISRSRSPPLPMSYAT